MWCNAMRVADMRRDGHRRPRCYSARMVEAIALVLLPDSPAYTLPLDLLHKARALDHARTALYWGGTLWMFVALWLLLRGRMGERIAGLAERATSRQVSGVRLPQPFVAGLVAAPLWLLLIALIGLPAGLIGHHLSLVYGLSVEGWRAWAGDWLTSTLLTVGIGTMVLATVYALLRHTGQLAWLWFWLATLPCVVVAVYAAPLIIDPLFNHFTPLAQRNPALVEQLERVVARGGLAIPSSRMFVMDASRRYTGINAYVTGFGASKRIVVWDTALAGASGAGVPSEELLAIYGHEQGHYVLGHIWKGMLYTAGLLLAFYWLAFRLLEALVRRRGGAWHLAESPGDWSTLGLVLLIAFALNFLAEPLANGFSRMEEHQADVYGLEVIHGLVKDPQEVDVEEFNRLGRVWLEVPAPNRLMVWWSYSHPPTSDRAEFARDYDPWVPGGHPRYFPR